MRRGLAVRCAVLAAVGCVVLQAAPPTATAQGDGLAAGDVEIDAVEHDMIAPTLAKPAGEATQLDFIRSIRHSALLCGISEHRAMPGCNNTYQPQWLADYAMISAA